MLEGFVKCTFFPADCQKRSDALRSTLHTPLPPALLREEAIKSDIQTVNAFPDDCGMADTQE